MAEHVIWSCNWCGKEHETDSREKVPVPQVDTKECGSKWAEAEAKRIAQERADAEGNAAPDEEEVND